MPTPYYCRGGCTIRGVFLAFLFGSALCRPAHGGTVYDYTGNPFTLLFGTTGDNSSQSITATLVFPSLLSADLSSVDESSFVESWSITDGIHTLTSSDAGAVLDTLALSTDDAGDIVGWTFYAGSGPWWLTSSNYLGSGPSDEYIVTPGFNPDAAVSVTLGVWNTESVPEPAGFGLLSGGFATLVFARRFTRTAARRSD